MRSYDYQYAFKRLDKLKNTLDQLIKQNIQLSEANAALRADHGTYQLREAARERVLAGMAAELEKYKNAEMGT